MDMKYDEYGQWIQINDGVAYVGISDLVQKMLGSVVFVKFPPLGTVCRAKDEVGMIEALKTVQELYSPIGGVITKVNEKLNDHPAKINKNPHETWLYALSNIEMNEYEKLYSLSEYETIFKELNKTLITKGHCGSC